METVAAYVSVGSNIEPERHVPAALAALAGTPGLRVTGVSTHYRTAPLDGRTDQGDYVNGVWAFSCGLGREAFRAALAGIEEREGRRRTGDRYEARTLDLDLLDWGGAVDPADGLPDGDVLERPFLWAALLELRPGFVWPASGRPLAGLVDRREAEGLRADAALTARLKGLIDG